MKQNPQEENQENNQVQEENKQNLPKNQQTNQEIKTNDSENSSSEENVDSNAENSESSQSCDNNDQCACGGSKELETFEDFFLFFAEEFGTDKFDHGYIEEYVKLFPENIDRLLEVGAWKGASLKMWKEIYSEEHVEIHTIENFAYTDCITQEEIKEMDVHLHEGSESDIQFLQREIKGEYDIIILDGSHFDHDRSISFRHLFANNLKNGGIICIEDMHTSNDPGWHPDQNERNNLLKAFYNFNKNEDFDSDLFPEHEKEFWKNTINTIDILVEDKLIVVMKKDFDKESE